jgi:hypothetical protein
MTQNLIVGSSINFAPLVPYFVIALLAGAMLVLVALAWYRRANGSLWRTLACATVLLALLNPSWVEEQREMLPDVAAIVVDRSPSQSVAGRTEATNKALQALVEKLGQYEGLEIRVIEAGGAKNGDDRGTELFDAASKALLDVPQAQVAGSIFITDGQIHDQPSGLRGPVHALISGNKNRRDRRLIVKKAPAYGLVDGNLGLVLRIEDSGDDGGGGDLPKSKETSATFKGAARISLSLDGGQAVQYDLRIGVDETIPFTLTHAGPTVVEINVAAGPQEITMRNNRAAVVINGVRDRLKVLLVSGKPHAGERTWRNLLKADPSVDLVHFTILRPPEKQDGTPVRELSLIAFPIYELFEVRLDEFDLIIFDRYHKRGVLPPAYFMNIAEYVENGGALLAAAGPEFASHLSIHRTALNSVLPAEPTSNVLQGGFLPKLSPIGRRHPVTADLKGSGSSDKNPDWGRWFRHIDAHVNQGVTVMTGAQSRPLLVLDRVGDGRVAQILSDHAWLWTRGFEGGGPQAELLRRMAHWLMKEPELEEEDLRAVVDRGRLMITRRSLSTKSAPVTVTLPSGQQQSLMLAPKGSGRATAVMAADEPGIYRVQDSKRKTLAVSGNLNSIEFASVHATSSIMDPVSKESGGGTFWLTDTSTRPGGVPALRRVKPDRRASGADWLGLVANGAYRVTGVRSVPLMPPALALILIAGFLGFAWWREGH